MANWPASLPNSQLDGYTFTPQDPVLRTDMETGTPRSRRRYTQAITLVKCMWKFDQTQMATFESFHHFTIADGAVFFRMPFTNGRGVNEVDARFAKMWSAQVVNSSPLLFEVQAELEIRARPIV